MSWQRNEFNPLFCKTLMNSDLLGFYRANKKALLFVSKLIGVYLLLDAFYSYVISPYTEIDVWLIDNLIFYSEKTLEFFGYEILPKDHTMRFKTGIVGSSGVIVGEPCNGLSLFILYLSFIIVFSGKWWFKITASIVGIFLIHVLNVLRVILLTLVVYKRPEQLDFHHSYTFTLLVYLFVFFLWMIRINIYKLKKI
jgi:exosortase family protein XrtF